MTYEYVENVYEVDADWLTSEELIKSEEKLSNEIEKIENISAENNRIINRLSDTSDKNLEKLRDINLTNFAVSLYVEEAEKAIDEGLGEIRAQSVKLSNLNEKIIDLLQFFKDNNDNFEVIDDEILFQEDRDVEKCKKILREIYTLIDEIAG